MAKQEAKLFDDTPFPPGEYLRTLLEQKRWTQDELATITGRSRQQIIDIVSGRRGITPEMALALAAAFGNTADLWLRIDSAYRLSQAQEDSAVVQRRAALFGLAPVKDMQRRGWIKSTKEIDEIEDELRRFFGAESLDTIPEFPVATRKSAPLADLNSSQRAWCFRARQIASALPVPSFDASRLATAKRDLRMLAAYPNEARRVSEIARQYGIRFIVIEPLPGSKIDGAAFWLDEASPVIAVSIRYDRIDAFWHTVMHEFMHVEAHDGLSVDTDLAGEDQTPPLMKDEMERRADEGAAASLVDPSELDSFVRRVGPLYAKPRIIQFAHRIRVHPGIIVGQLQHRGEIGYSANREMLAKIREHVTNTSVTDGWGHEISPGTL